MPLTTIDTPAEPTADGTPPERVYADGPDGVENSCTPQKQTRMERIESFFERLSTRNNFWRKFCSWIWLPIAYRSGIKKVKRGKPVAGEPEPFVALLPFRRFNRNWYSAMAGAALLANSEIAGGMYVFDVVGSEYTVVCKELHYKFRLPCHGPAVYRVATKDNLKELVSTGGEFNINVEISIYQALKKAGDGRSERKVGVSSATFHVTPKAMAKERVAKMRERDRRRIEKHNK